VLLGLVVDLNQVVLSITGLIGAGDLLGNLLCTIAGLPIALPTPPTPTTPPTPGTTGILNVLSNLLNAVIGILALGIP